MSTLQDYLNATRRLLHDALGRYYTDLDLKFYINSACSRAVADSTCYRVLQTVYLSTGLEQYAYGGVTGALVSAGGSGYTNASTVTFSAPQTAGGTTATGTLVVTGGAVVDLLITNVGSGYTAAPTLIFSGPGSAASLTPSILNPNTLDVMNITLDWGQTRVILDRKSFTEFQASVRAWIGYQQRPGICASYGQSNWFIGPLPDQTYVSEWDTLLVPPTLVSATDISVINYPYSDPVPFYAAHIAKLNEQSFSESEQFLQLYQQKMRYAIRSTMMRKLSSAYGS